MCHELIELVGHQTFLVRMGGGGVQARDRHLTIFLGL